MIEGAIWSFLLRFCQTLVLCSPSLLMGIMLAAMIRTLIPPTRLKSFVSPKHPADLLPVAVVVAAVPICSFGVLPMLEEFRRSGIRSRALATFALVAPKFNLWSLVFGLTLMPFWFWGYLVGGAVGVAVITGWLWSCRNQDNAVNAYNHTRQGPRNLVQIIRNAADIMSSPSLRDILVGLFCAATLAALLPHDFMSDQLAERHWYSIPIITLTTLPAFTSPETGMMQAYKIFGLGTLPGAGLIFLVSAAGLNCGLLSFFWRHFGAQKVLRFVTIFALIIFCFAIPADVLMTQRPANDEDNDAFVDYGRSPQLEHAENNHARVFWDRLRPEILPSHVVSLGMLGLLLVAGLAIPKTKQASASTETAATQQEDPAPLPVWAVRILPLGIMTGIGIFTFYSYFPSGNATVDRLGVVDADIIQAVLADDRPLIKTRLAEAQSLADKVKIGQYIRFGTFSHSQHANLQTYQLELVQLQNALATNAQHQELKQTAMAMGSALKRCKADWNVR